MGTTIEQKVLDCAVELWQKRFCGISSLDISSELNLSNKKVMAAMLILEEDDRATLNKDVKLFQIRFTVGRVEHDVKPTICHIIFPTTQILTDYFYSSELLEKVCRTIRRGCIKGHSSSSDTTFPKRF